MRKLKMKFLSALAIFCLIITLLPNVAFAEETDGVIPKTKTATNLDNNFDSEVNLTFVGKEAKVIDVVFVVDCTSIGSFYSGQMYKQLELMANELDEAQDVYQVNVALIGFGHEARTFLELTDLNDVNLDELKTTFESKETESWINNNGGTNIQKGVLAGKEILDNSHTGAPVNCRYMVLMTDGGGFWYNNDKGETVQTVFAGNHMPLANMDSGPISDIPTAHQNDSMYLRAVKEGKNFADFISEQGSAIEASAIYSYTSAEAKTAAHAYSVQDIGQKDENGNWTVYPYTNMERGTYFAAKALQSVKAEGYKIKTIGYYYWAGWRYSSLSQLTTGFREWTKTIGSYYDGSYNTAKMFSDLKDEMYQYNYIDHGSVVIDEMGYGEYEDGKPYDLDFDNDIEKLTLKVDGKELVKTQIDKNTYGFGEQNEETKEYPFVLTYCPNGTTYEGKTYKECFKIEINVPVTPNKSVSLTYHVTLPEEYRQSETGTYGNYDRDGSQRYDGLKTNHVAEIYPEDSHGEKGNTEQFPEPTVSYDIVKVVEEYNISGTKTWNDGNNQDGIRPNSIDVKLQKKVGQGNWTDINGQTKTVQEGQDKSWTYSFENLPRYENDIEIQYRVVEVTVPDGYIVEYDETHLNITNTHEPTPSTTTVNINKVDNDGKAVVGAQLSILDSHNNKILSFTSDDSAYEIIGKLNVGETYILHEEKAPEGYKLADDVEFTVRDYGEITHVIMIDEKEDEEVKIDVLPNLIIYKVNQDKNFLSGASFQLNRVENGKEVFVEEQSGGPKFEFKELKDGLYRIYEIQAPDGYEGLDTYFEVEVINGQFYYEGEINYSFTVINTDDGTIPSVLGDEIDEEDYDQWVLGSEIDNNGFDESVLGSEKDYTKVKTFDNANIVGYTVLLFISLSIIIFLKRKLI